MQRQPRPAQLDRAQGQPALQRSQLVQFEFERVEGQPLGPLGIDIALSSRQVAASMILRFVRRGAVGTVATIMNSDAEAMEIKVPVTRNFDNVALKDLNFPKGAIIGAIVRGRKILIPSGNTRVQAEDNLVVFFTRDAVKLLERYFDQEE